MTVYSTATSLFSPSTATEMTYTVKWVISDEYSDSDDAKVEEIFDLTVEDLCALNELSQSGTIEDVLHYIQSGSATTVTPSISGSASSSCPATYTLYFWDAANYDWEAYSSSPSDYAFVSSFSTSTGQLQIYSTDYATYEDYTVRTKIVVVDSRSSATLNTLEDEFDITVKDQCRDVVVNTSIVGFSGTESSPYSWHMW